MKKILIAAACFALVAGGSSLAFAGASSQSSPGSQVTISANNVSSGMNFTFNPSPNVQIVAYTSSTAYAMMTTHDLTDENNGMVYGATNASTGYAQRQKTATEASSGLTALSSTTLSGTWTWMGSSS